MKPNPCFQKLMMGWATLFFLSIGPACGSAFADPAPDEMTEQALEQAASPKETSKPAPPAAVANPAPPPSQEPKTPAREVDEEGLHYVPSPLHFAMDFQFNMPNYTQYVLDTSSNTLLQQQSYGGRMAFEWVPLTSAGKLGVALGLGFDVAANAQVNSSQTNLYTIPLDFTVIYHADFVRNQILVPFVQAGIEVTGVIQSSLSGYNVYKGFQYGGGLELCLNFIEPSNSKRMDSTFGINGTYLVAEYVFSTPLSPGTAPDLTHQEWRFGLRFEF